MNNESKEPPLGYKMIQGMTATKLLNDAAPEMLEALETLVEEEWAKGSNFEKYVIALIKKAKGEI